MLGLIIYVFECLCNYTLLLDNTVNHVAVMPNRLHTGLYYKYAI